MGRKISSDRSQRRLDSISSVREKSGKFLSASSDVLNFFVSSAIHGESGVRFRSSMIVLDIVARMCARVQIFTLVRRFRSEKR